MLRCGALGLLLFLLLAPSPAAASDDWVFAVGLKNQYITLKRTLKLENGTEKRYPETPDSASVWMNSLVLSAAYGPWFVGVSAGSSRILISDQPSGSISNSRYFKSSTVDLREVDLALGYTIISGVSPYIGYLRHAQQTDCSGCTTTVELSQVGPGLIIAYPVSGTRWAAFMNVAKIQGFSIEGGFSYAGIRWPLVGVAGFAYRKIDYPSGRVSCGSFGGVSCHRESDVISGPTLAVNYIF